MKICFHVHATCMYQLKPPFFDYTVECLHFEFYHFLHYRLTSALLDTNSFWTLLFSSFNRHTYTRVGNNFPQHRKRKSNSAQQPCFTNNTLTLAVPLLHHHSIFKLSINLINVVSQIRSLPEHQWANSWLIRLHLPQQLPITSLTSQFHFSFDTVIIIVHNRSAITLTDSIPLCCRINCLFAYVRLTQHTCKYIRILYRLQILYRINIFICMLC
jgi:hypothetical protein